MLPPDTIIVRPEYTPFPEYTGGIELRTQLLLRICNSLISEEEKAYYRENWRKWSRKEMKKRDQETANRIAYRSLPEPKGTAIVLSHSNNQKAA